MTSNKWLSALTPLLFMVNAQIAGAQDLSIVSSNGTVSVLDLATIESIVFTNNNLVVHSTDCQDNYHSLFFTDMVTFDEVNGLLETTTDLHELFVYPNPASDVLTVEQTSGRPIGNGAVYNIVGKTVTTFSSTANTCDVSIGHLPAGIYFVAINNQLIKFLKQ